MTSAHPHTALIGFDFLKSFTSAARSAYEECTPEEPPSCFALLLGTVEDGVAHIAEVEFATNARASDPTAVAEFSGTIAACFGAAYRNTRRGFWCSSRTSCGYNGRPSTRDSTYWDPSICIRTGTA